MTNSSLYNMKESVVSKSACRKMEGLQAARQPA